MKEPAYRDIFGKHTLVADRTDRIIETAQWLAERYDLTVVTGIQLVNTHLLLLIKEDLSVIRGLEEK